jgi:O-antigen/teichoic acid export membrane protein
VSARPADAARSVRRNSLYSVVGFAVPSLLLFGATPPLVHELGAAGYGLWSISLATLGLMGTLDLGLGGALAKYVAEYVEAENLRSLSAAATLGILMYGVIAACFTSLLFLEANTVAGIFAGPNAPRDQVATVVRLTALGLIPLLLRGAGTAFITGLQRFDLLMIASLAQNTSIIGAALVVTYSGGSVRDVVLSSLLVFSVFSALVLVVGCRAILRMGARPLLARGQMRKLLSFVAFMGVSNIGTAIFESADRLTVAATIGPAAVTYYTVPISVANKILYTADIACRPLMPAASGWISAGRTQVVKAHLRSATLWTAFGALTASLVGLSFSRPFMRIWMGPAFAAHALSTFRVLLVVYALLALAAPAYHVANGVGMPWLGAVTAIVGGAASIALIVLLAPPLGVVGAAWANFAYCITLVIPIVLRRALRNERVRPGVSGPLPPMRFGKGRP